MVAMARDNDTRNVDETDRHPNDAQRRLRVKNLAVAGVLVALIVLFYFVAIVRMSGG